MRVLNVKKLFGSWGEIREDYHIYLNDISPTKSLSQAILEYFSKIMPCPWPMNYSFLELECANCNETTVYDNLNDIPFSPGDEGQLVCPCCQHPWLTYRYDK